MEESSFEFRNTSFVIQRCCIDATGLGAMLAEELEARWGARVEPVVFTSAVKEDLAVRVKRLLEERRLKLPYDPAIRAAFGAVNRIVTPAGNVRFDAERTDQSGHADHFWALALALAAAEEPAPSVEFVSSSVPRAFAQSRVF
jgi:phage FluMu gp28-like protein